jgi:hypothetical protein
MSHGHDKWYYGIFLVPYYSYLQSKPFGPNFATDLHD